MKRALAALLLCLALVLSGCAAPGGGQERYSVTYLDLFDTVTTITGRAESQPAFEALAGQLHDRLLDYHRLFDIYHEYEGLVNLKTVNDRAGQGPVEVDGRIIELLLDCLEYEQTTRGRVNVAMGGVLSLWHEARTYGTAHPDRAALPDPAALERTGEHTDLDAVVIDPESSTVAITDSRVSLDVGAVAKGWAVEQVALDAPEGLLLSVGGNVCATGPKDETGAAWIVGLQDARGGEDYLHTLALTRGSVVTSGDYQRRYWVGDTPYHHIIDPETLYPGTLWRSVTVVCPDSGLADALSTALFLLPLEEGLALLRSCEAEAMWVDPEGICHYSPGFEAMIRT